MIFQRRLFSPSCRSVITMNILARRIVLYDRLMIETLVINVTFVTVAFSLSLQLNFGIDYSQSLLSLVETLPLAITR